MLPVGNGVAKMKHPTRILALLCALIAAFLTRQGWGVHERFESAEVSWRLAEADGAARLIQHERDFTVARTGKGSEHLQVWSAQATYVHLAHPVPAARIIDELVPSLWVKSDRPGLRLKLRVVLPRTYDRAGKTLTVLLDGDFYSQQGAWQRLEVRNLKKLFEAEVRIRRAQLGAVDASEAYIDHFVLNAYSGSGITKIWIDDLELTGFASSQPTTTSIAFEGFPSTGAPPSGLRGSDPRSAELRGSVLLVDDRPYFARAIEYNGEPLAFLKRLGFNTIVFHEPPTAAQLAECAQAGVWLVAPPTLTNGSLTITPAHQRVIAWRLGTNATAADLPLLADLAAQLHRQDQDAARPIMCDVAHDVERFVGMSDLLMIGRPSIGTSFDLRRYGDWLQQRTRPLGGKPFWGAIQTEPSVRLIDQLAVAYAGQPTPQATSVQLPKLSADPQQIRLLAFEAIASGARGVCFRSRSRLDVKDDVAKLRAASLTLVNTELSLVEPWAAGGSFVKEIDLGEQHTRGRILETDRSRLLIIARHAPGQQFVSHPQRMEPIAFVAHSIAITDQAYHLGTGGLKPLLSSQSSGRRIKIQDPDAVSLVLFTQDPLAVNRCTRQLSDSRETTATLEHEIASIQLRQTSAVVAELGASKPLNEKLIEARALIDRAEQLLRSGDARDAILATRTAHNMIRRVQHETWEQAVLAFPSPMSSALCSSFATLPLHAKVANRMATATWSDNVLPAGDCESLNSMLRAGWHQQPSEDGLNSLVELSLQDPAGGRSALRMVTHRQRGSAVAVNPQPLAITTGPIAATAGQTLRIHGWVKVTDATVGSDDGLMIFDSLAGEELAERITQTRGWQEFTLYRIATRSGDISLTFALTDQGEAWIDEVSVAILK